MKKSVTESVLNQAPQSIVATKGGRERDFVNSPSITETYPQDLELGPAIVSITKWTFRHRRSLIRWAFIGLLAGVIVAFIVPIRYESTTRLMPPDDNRTRGLALLTALNGQGNGLGLATGLLGMKNSGDLFVGILESRTIQDDLIRKFDLRKVYNVRYWETARKKLFAKTEITQDPKSGIVSVVVTDGDPARCQAMSQEYADSLNRVVSDLSTSSARREREFLETRLAAVKEELDSSAVEFSQFASTNTTIDISEQGKAMVESAARLQGELIAAESELNGIEQIYSSTNVRVRSLKARIDELRKQLQIIGGTANEKSDGSENADSIYPSIRKLPLLGVRYSDLYRKVKINEAVYEALTKEYELARVEEAKEIPTVRILDPANAPEIRSFPPRSFIILAGGFCGLPLCWLWISVRDAWRQAPREHPMRLLVAELQYEFTRRREN